MDVVSMIIDYENGELGDEEIVELFQELCDSRVIFSLQGSYQRMASALVSAKLIQLRGQNV